MAIDVFVESPELDVTLQDPLVDADTVPYAFLKGDPGFSPVVRVADVQGGHNVTITDAEGDHTFFVPDGRDGDPGGPGFSPEVSIASIPGGHQVTITDVDGQHRFNVMDGDPGDPGFSPEVNVTPIAGGHEITITDDTGSQSFDVMDGAPGQDATFWATKDVTTSEEIEEAYQSKKLVVCEIARRIYTMIRRQSAARHEFSCIDTIGGATTVHSFEVYADSWGAIVDKDVGSSDTSKLDKDQGLANAGKVMVVGSDGIIAPETAYLWTGGTY